MADYISKFPAHQIDALLEQGVPIYDDVSKLPQDATVGSLAVVAVPGTSKESSFRDLYQPTMDMIDQATGTLINPERLSSISSLKITAPSSFELEGDIGVLFIPRTFSAANNNMLKLALQGGTGIAAAHAINNNEEHVFVLVDYSSGSPVINNDSIKQFNDILATDDWCYFGNPESTTGITEEQFNTLDMYVKAVLGVPSTASIYLKKDNWEELYRQDFEKLAKDIEQLEQTKVDVMDITTLGYLHDLKPNVYCKYVCEKSSGLFIGLVPPVDETKYVEYILELTCVQAPEFLRFNIHDGDGSDLKINWANGVAPSFKKDYTYLISISNGLGVYSIFPNE